MARARLAGDPGRGRLRSGGRRSRLPPRCAQRQPLLSRRPRGARRLELDVARDGGALGAFIAGVWAAVVGLPPPETAPMVRDLQRRQLAVALDWVDREL